MAAKSPSKLIEVTSAAQFNSILSSSKAVVADFYADWCGPCKVIAPVIEDFANTYSRKDLLTFVKINTDNVPDVTKEYKITAMPTFLYLENGKEWKRVQGTDRDAFLALIDRWKAVTSGSVDLGESSSGSIWRGAALPRGYKDVTDQVDIRNLEMRNSDSGFGDARTLFESSTPSSLSKGKGKSAGGSAEGTGKDWVESDIDPQLMLHIPFQSTLKVHSIQITSLPPTSDDGDDDDEIPMRPREIRLFTNKPNIVGFEDEDPPEQVIELSDSQWDSSTGTATVELRFVKFQKVSTLCIFVVEGDGEGEKTRIDRIRIIGESGEKRDLGKLEKIGDDGD